MQVFTPSIDDSLVTKWIERLNSLKMKCEIHPDFSFITHSGFLPFKIKLLKTDNQLLIVKEYLTGFELFINEFDLNKEIEISNPRHSFIDRLMGKKSSQTYFASPAIDARLKTCNKLLHCEWSTNDSFELRMATLSAAVLAEITDGICFYPAQNFWYLEENEVEKALIEVEAYEASIKPNQFKLHKFEKWF